MNAWCHFRSFLRTGRALRVFHRSRYLEIHFYLTWMKFGMTVKLSSSSWRARWAPFEGWVVGRKLLNDSLWNFAQESNNMLLSQQDTLAFSISFSYLSVHLLCDKNSKSDTPQGRKATLLHLNASCNTSLRWNLWHDPFSQKENCSPSNK